MVKIYEDERVDQLFAGDISIIQSPHVFCYSIDSILLAHFPRMPKQGLVVDMCAGNGAVGLFASKRCKTRIVQIELQERLADMGRRNIELNQLTHQMEMLHLNLKEAHHTLAPDSVDLILVNPPYFKQEKESKQNPNPYLAIARHEIEATLTDVLHMSRILLKSNGRLAMVHRPERLIDILNTFQEFAIAPKRIQFVHPREDKEANTVLIEGIKNGSTNGLKILPPLIVHDENGDYTKVMQEMYYGK